MGFFNEHGPRSAGGQRPKSLFGQPAPFATSPYGVAGTSQLAPISASKTVSGVYGWMTVGVGISAAVGAALLFTGFIGQLLAGGMGFMIVLMIAQVGLVFAMSLAAERLSVGALKGMFLAYSALTGVTFATLGLVYPIGNIVGLFFVAAIGFAALAIFGMATKKDLGFMGTFLIMGLFMVIGASLVNLFVHSMMLDKFAGWAGILVFSGLTAYDSQRIRNSALELESSTGGDAGVMGRFMVLGALTMYLNFINLFLSLLRVMGDRRD